MFFIRNKILKNRYCLGQVATSGGKSLIVSIVFFYILENIDPDAKVIFGAVVDESLPEGEVKVTVIATGFDQPNEPKRVKGFRDEELSDSVKEDLEKERIQKREQDMKAAAEQKEKEEKKMLSEIVSDVRSEWSIETPMHGQAGQFEIMDGRETVDRMFTMIMISEKKEKSE